MATSQKDYVKIAAELATAKQLVADSYKDSSYQEIAVDAVMRASVRVAQALAASNPRFDRARFLAACGFEGA